ncbi:MAG TPA: PhzF family phenazine biosynthesis protein [Chloroflexota bacterium]
MNATIGETAMPFQFILCDVFADRPLAGNQLAVFPDGTALPADVMAALAQEFGWSEITFVLPRDAEVPRVRIWTPEGELPFAGHPTIGTAVVLAVNGVLPPSGGTLELGAGEVEVEVTNLSPAGGRATMTQRTPTFGTGFPDRERLARALSLSEPDLAPDLPAQVVSTGAEHFMVPLATLEALGRVRPVSKLFTSIASEVGMRRFYVFTVDTPGSSAAARARLIGVAREDAATGSAAGPLGAYLVHYGLHRAGALDIEQGIEMGRPSRIAVDVSMIANTLGPVRVSGNVHIWGQGTIEVAMAETVA